MHSKKEKITRSSASDTIFPSTKIIHEADVEESNYTDVKMPRN